MLDELDFKRKHHVKYCPYNCTFNIVLMFMNGCKISLDLILTSLKINYYFLMPVTPTIFCSSNFKEVYRVFQMSVN